MRFLSLMLWVVLISITFLLKSFVNYSNNLIGNRDNAEDGFKDYKSSHFLFSADHAISLYTTQYYLFLFYTNYDTKTKIEREKNGFFFVRSSFHPAIANTDITIILYYGFFVIRNEFTTRILYILFRNDRMVA